MEPNNTPDTMGVTLGKLFAGAFLYDFNDDGKTGPQLIQVSIGKAKKYLGAEEAKKLFSASESQISALLCSCIDRAVVGRLLPDTTEAISKLQNTERVFVEMVYLRAVGEDLTHHSKDTERWFQPLWNLKKIAKKYIALSPSEVTEEELATALKNIALPLASTLRQHVSKML